MDIEENSWRLRRSDITDAREHYRRTLDDHPTCKAFVFCYLKTIYKYLHTA